MAKSKPARNPRVSKKEAISVGEVIQQLSTTKKIDIRAVNDLDAKGKMLVEADLHRPGLAIAGYVDLFTHHRAQILGNTENRYLAQLAPDKRKEAFKNLTQFPIPCIILTENNHLDEALLDIATEANIPVYVTTLPTTRFISLFGEYLNEQFAPQVSLHGSLVDVYGIGLFIMGKSGIGKSEVALDLVERGHRLVADDVVIVTKQGENILIGSGTDLVQHFMEVRGLGLVDVRAMFGIRATRSRKRVEVVVNMHHWDADEDYTRIDMVEEYYDVLGVSIPLVKVPIIPGKNITVICEVIAMNYLLLHHGYDSAKVFAKRLGDRILGHKSGFTTTGDEYFEQDYE